MTWYRTIATPTMGRKHGALLHRVRAEKALGHSLPPKAIVHHADGSMRDDAPLVICQDQAYHKLLHVRMKIKAMGGDPNTQLWCSKCRQVKVFADFRFRNRNGRSVSRSICKECQSTEFKTWWHKNRKRGAA